MAYKSLLEKTVPGLNATPEGFWSMATLAFLGTIFLSYHQALKQFDLQMEKIKK